MYPSYPIIRVQSGSTQWGLMVLFTAALILGLAFGARMQREGPPKSTEPMTSTVLSTEMAPRVTDSSDQAPRMPILWNF